LLNNIHSFNGKEQHIKGIISDEIAILTNLSNQSRNNCKN